MKKFKIVKKPAVAAAEAAATIWAAAENPSFRLIDFNVYDCVPDTNTHSSASENSGSSSGGDDSSSVASADSARGAAVDLNEFRIQMFGINEQGETCSIFVDDYHPFFYIKVADHWTNATKSAFIRDIKKNLKSRYYENSILTDKCELVEKRKLYGFDGGKNHKFVLLVFKNTTVMNRVKNLWYCHEDNDNKKPRILNPNGYVFEDPTTKTKTKTKTYIYEANIPPILRFFHIQKISP